MKHKKGLSPVITTILLVLLAIVLAIIILLWAKKGIGEEVVLKFNPSAGEERLIEETCGLVRLQATISGSNILVNNIGSVPIYGFGIRVAGGGSSDIEEKTEINLSPGKSITLTPTASPAGKTVELIPILLGKSQESGDYSKFSCLNNPFRVE